MKFSPTEWEQENIKNCEESKSTVTPFTECNRGHLPSQASGLRVSGTFSLNSPSSQREAVTLSDTQQLAGAKDSGSRVGHDTGGPRLALAATGLPMGQFSTRPPPPPRLSTNHPPWPQEDGWPLPAGKRMGTRGRPTALRPEGVAGRRNGTQEDEAAAHSKYATWLSPKPLSQRGTEKAASGWWSRPASLDQEPADGGGTCPQAPSKRGWQGHCEEAALSSCCVHVPRRPGENGLRCSEPRSADSDLPTGGGRAAGQTRARLQQLANLPDLGQIPQLLGTPRRPGCCYSGKSVTGRSSWAM